MNYYYDVLLNFQDKYYMFYEWDELDNVEFIKKIPLFHVNNKTFLEFYTKVVKVELNFLKQIENKTKIKQNEYLKYACIISDGKNSIAIEFDDLGLVISKSSLILDDEISVNEFMYSINNSEIKYEIVDNDIRTKETRQELKIKKILKIEIQKMYEQKEESKLKYIYIEWFNELLDNTDTMYHNMINKLRDNLTEKEYKIYEIINLSYNNV